MRLRARLSAALGGVGVVGVSMGGVSVGAGAAIALAGCGSSDDTSEPPGDASVRPDAAPGADAGPVFDASGEASTDGATGCGPKGPVAAAPTYAFVGPDAGGCNVAQLDTLSLDCFGIDGGDAGTTTCGGFRASAANAACLACVYGTSSDAPTLQRPIYTLDFPAGSSDALVFANVAGCVAAVAPAEAACAQSIAAASACETSQCAACGFDLDASTVGAGDLDVINGCIAAAAAGPCASIEASSVACTTRLFAANAGAVRACGSLVDPSTGRFTADVTSYLFVACGGAPDKDSGS